MWLRFTDVEIGTKTIQMRKDLAKGQSYETVVENTGYSGGNGIAAECGNRDSESEIIFGNSQFVVHTPMVFVLDNPAVSDSVSAGVFTRRKVFLTVVLFVLELTAAIANSVLLVFRTTPFTASDLRLMKYAATLLTTYLTWWQIILMAAAAVAAILFCVLALAKGTGGSAESKPYRVRLCGCCNHAGNLGNVEFFSCLRPCGTSFWKHRPGLQGLWSGVLFCQLSVEYRD